MSDIYEAIRADHEHHRDLLDRLAKSKPGSEDRRAAWKDFYYDVKSHAAAEEETFYGPLMKKQEGQEDARHSVAEHKEMDDLIDLINAIDPSSDQWMKQFESLKERYEHHMEEEEEDLFAKAREVLPEAAKDDTGARFEARKSAEKELVDRKSEEKLEE